MVSTPLFLGLTRQVSFAGLPVSYLSVLIGIVMLGFIITGSFSFLVGAGGVGYAVLRALAAYDPKIIDVCLITLQRTQMSAALWRGDGVVYRA